MIHKTRQGPGYGLILVFFHERLFWSVWRAGDSVTDQVVTRRPVAATGGRYPA